MSLEPLYKTVPIAARRAPLLYEMLALLDALRDGRTRDRRLAEKELVSRLLAGSGLRRTSTPSPKWHPTPSTPSCRSVFGNLDSEKTRSRVTKLEVFRARGEGDVRGSHDLEDVITVIDGRSEIIEDVRSAPADVRVYISAELQRLLATRAFIDALLG